MTAATSLIRDAGSDGTDIHIVEAGTGVSGAPRTSPNSL